MFGVGRVPSADQRADPENAKHETAGERRREPACRFRRRAGAHDWR
jgi:hypothetical protein